MFLIAELKQENGNLIALVTVPSKEFKTGSKGFFGSTKADIEGKRYQIQVQVVEIGSKNLKERDAQ